MRPYLLPKCSGIFICALNRQHFPILYKGFPHSLSNWCKWIRMAVYWCDQTFNEPIKFSNGVAALTMLMDLCDSFAYSQLLAYLRDSCDDSEITRGNIGHAVKCTQYTCDYPYFQYWHIPGNLTCQFRYYILFLVVPRVWRHILGPGHHINSSISGALYIRDAKSFTNSPACTLAHNDYWNVITFLQNSPGCQWFMSRLRIR